MGEFKRTVDQPIDLGTKANRPEELRKLDRVRIWGTRTGDRNETMWEKLQPGDIMMFYCNGWFFSAGRIDQTIRSSAGGEHIWDNAESQLIYTLKDYHRVAVPKHEVWGWFDYKENFTRRGFSRVATKRVESFRNEVGDIWDYLLKYAADSSIEEILANGGTTDHPSPSYFILRTGSGGYEDEPTEEYHFKEGISGSKQLRKAEGDGVFVYLKDNEFYAVGRTGAIRTEDRDGTKHYFAAIEDYQEINPIPLEDVRDLIEPDFPIQYGIIKIQKDDYELIIDGDVRENDEPSSLDVHTDHPILNYLRESDNSVTAHWFSAPVEYWVTSVATATISFDGDDENEWKRIAPGDIVLFHRRQSALENTKETDPGFIGAGVVRGRTTKSRDEPWWWDEFNTGTSRRLLVAFEQLYFAGDVDAVVGPNPVDNQTEPEDLTDEIGAFAAGSLTIDRAQNLVETHTGQTLTLSDSFSTFLQDGEPELERPSILLAAMIENLINVPAVDMYRSFTEQLDDDILDGLYFPDHQGTDVIEQVTAALRAGKHIILTGPPGTGKTEIARRTCDYLAAKYPHLYSGFQLTTATADWSTFDTVGGYMSEETSSDDRLAFNPGIILNRLKRARLGTQLNEPIVIDELNRADIDKSFGQLVTLLSGQSVQLPYTIDGTEVELCNVSDIEGLPASNQYIVPKSWRIFATMNTYDKTSLYEMSYAFMRRFAFIRVSTPELPEEEQDVEDLMHNYVDEWDDIDWDRDIATEVGLVWRATNTAVEGREIGPAIVKDMLGYIMAHESPSLDAHLTEAVISFIFPQLEGVPRRKQILQNIANVSRIDRNVLDEASRDMLQESVVGRNE